MIRLYCVHLLLFCREKSRGPVMLDQLDQRVAVHDPPTALLTVACGVSICVMCPAHSVPGRLVVPATPDAAGLPGGKQDCSICVGLNRAIF